MNENCSSILNIKDSFNNLIESQFDISIFKKPSTVGYSTPSDKTNNELKNIINVLTLEMNKEKSKKQESKHKINKLKNKRKSLPLELLDDLLKTFKRRFVYNWQAKNILLSSRLVYIFAKEIFKKPEVYKYVWKYDNIDYARTCCSNNCINNYLYNPFAGFIIQINDLPKTVYINCRVNGKNEYAGIVAENNLNKLINEFNQKFSLYYYKVKLIFEKDDCKYIDFTYKKNKIMRKGYGKGWNNGWSSGMGGGRRLVGSSYGYNKWGKR